MELDAGQPGGETCRHFSIRRFVADVRETNREECWPFPMEEQGEELPPLDVPIFKYWLCEKKRLIGELVDVAESILHSDLHIGGLNPSVCVNGVKNKTPLCSDMQDGPQSSKEDCADNVQDKEPLCINIQEGFKIREDDHLSVEGDVATVKDNRHKEDEDDGKEDVNEDTCSLKGCIDTTAKCLEVASPKLLSESRLLSDLHGRGLNPSVSCANCQLPIGGNTPELLSDSQRNSREETCEVKRADHSVCVSNVKRNTPICGDMRDGPQQSSKKECVGGERTDSVDNVRSDAPLCINIQEGSKIREDDYPSAEDDVVAVEDNGRNEDEDDTEKNENEDTCSPKGCNDTTAKCVKVASPELMGVKRKRESKADGGVKKACNRKPGFSRPSETKLNHKSKLPLILDNIMRRIDNEKRGNHHLRKKGRKSMKIEDILKRAPSVSKQDIGSTGDKTADLAQIELEESGSGLELSIGFDLNLSPTDQVVEEQDTMVFQDKDEEPLQNTLQKDVAEKAEDAAARDQHATFVDDGTCDSHKKKCVVPQYEGREPLPIIAPDDTSRGVQTANGNEQIGYTRPKANRHKIPTNVSSGRVQHSDIGIPIARQSEVREILGDRNKSGNSEVLGGKLPLLPPKRGILPQMETGSSSLDQQSENLIEPRRPNISKRKRDQGTNKPSEQEDSDDIPMEIVELMAKNQYERALGASENSDYMLGKLTYNVEGSNRAEKAEVLRTELLRNLHVEEFRKQKSQSINQGCRGSTETMRVGSNHPTQAIRRPNGIISLPEQSCASRGFTSFPQNLDRPLSGAQLLLGTSNKISGDKNSPFSRNPEIPSSRAPFLAGSSCRDRTFTFSKNQDNLLNGSEFLFGNSTSSGNFANLSSAISKNPGTPSDKDQFPRSTPRRLTGNQKLTFSDHRQKAATRTQTLSCSSSRNGGTQNHNCSGKLAGDKHSQSSLTPEKFQTSQTVAWPNSFKDDRHAWLSMKSNFLPLGNRNSANFAAVSSATNKPSQCLDLFPKGDMKQDSKGDYSLKSMDLTTNQIENRKSNMDLDGSRGTRPEYSFGGSERRYQFNLQSMRPVDLYNNDKIPATQLLRLMDAGMSPSRPIDVDEDQDLTPHPSMPHQQWEVSRFGHSKNNAVFCPPSSNFLSSNPGHQEFVGNSSVSEVDAAGPTVPTVSESNTSGYSASSIPRLNTIGSLLQKKDIIRKDPDSSGIYPAKLIPQSAKDQMKGKAKFMSSAQSGNSRSNKAPYGNGDLVKDHEFGYMRRGWPSNPESVSSLAHSLEIKDSTNHAGLEVNGAGTVCRGRSLTTEPCILNRNPADFTVPEAGNKYTRAYGDFKRKEKVLSEDATGLIELVGNKRQKKVKLAAINDK